MDKIKDELKTLYTDENLTDFEIETMSKRLIQFYALLVKQYQSQKNINQNREKDPKNAK